MSGPLGPLEGEWFGFERNLEEALAEVRRATEAMTCLRKMFDDIDDPGLPPRFEQQTILENWNAETASHHAGP